MWFKSYILRFQLDNYDYPHKYECFQPMKKFKSIQVESKFFDWSKTLARKMEIPIKKNKTNSTYTLFSAEGVLFL